MEAADPGSFEGQHQEITTQDASKLKEEVQEMKSANQNLKLQVAEIVEKLENLQQNMSQYQEVFDHELKMKEELMELKSENGHFKQKGARLEQKVNQLEQDALNTKEVNKKQHLELLAIKEELGQLKQELQELKLENESLKSQGLEVDGKVNQLEESNSLLSRQVREHLQKLEDERFRMKEELVDFKNDKLKMKEELMECNSGKLKILVDLNSDKLRMKEALEDLKWKYESLKLNAIQTDVSDAVSELSSWVQVHQDVESSMLHSATSAFSVETNGPRCFMLDAVFKTPSGAFLSGTDLHLSLVLGLIFFA